MGWLWSDASSQERLLYAYLDRAGLPSRLAVAELVPQRLVLGHRPVRVRPLVWLTDDQVATSFPARITAHASASTIGVRLTVATSAAMRWPAWAARNRVSRHALRRIEHATDGLSERLWVTPAALPASQWIRADDVETGALLWRADAAAAPVRPDAAYG